MQLPRKIGQVWIDGLVLSENNRSAVRGGDDLVTDDEAGEDAAQGGDPLSATELVRRYREGETIEGIAENLGVSYRKVRTTLLEAGVTLRPPKVRLPPTPPGLVHAYLSGRNIRQLAETYGMTYSQTRRILLAEGVILRPRGRH
ncbi:helix-turn-helix domain-containing protein [Amycolatopsis japonica]